MGDRLTLSMCSCLLRMMSSRMLNTSSRSRCGVCDRATSILVKTLRKLGTTAVTDGSDSLAKSTPVIATMGTFLETKCHRPGCVAVSIFSSSASSRSAAPDSVFTVPSRSSSTRFINSRLRSGTSPSIAASRQ